MKKLNVIISGLAFTFAIAFAISSNAAVIAWYRNSAGVVTQVSSQQTTCSGTASMCTALVNGQVVSPIYSTQAGAQNQTQSLILKFN